MSTKLSAARLRGPDARQELRSADPTDPLELQRAALSQTLLARARRSGVVSRPAPPTGPDWEERLGGVLKATAFLRDLLGPGVEVDDLRLGCGAVYASVLGHTVRQRAGSVFWERWTPQGWEGAPLRPSDLVVPATGAPVLEPTAEIGRYAALERRVSTQGERDFWPQMSLAATFLLAGLIVWWGGVASKWMVLVFLPLLMFTAAQSWRDSRRHAALTLERARTLGALQTLGTPDDWLPGDLQFPGEVGRGRPDSPY